jgi:hypothetical protein
VHLQIKPVLRQVWRSASTLQIGLDPRFGTVLDGLTDPDRPLLDALGSGIDADRRSAGGARERELVRLLDEAGVLARRRTGRDRAGGLGAARDRLAPDAAAWSLLRGPRAQDGEGADAWDLLAARGRRTVRVEGAGRTGTAVATTLACAGVGRLDVIDPAPVGPGDVTPAGAHAGDVGRTRQEAARAAVQRVTGRAPAPDAGAVRAAPTPDLVVLVEAEVADATGAQPLVAADVPHLSVVIREATIVVGPLVLPGRGSCLRCLDLHRSDRDPAWPRILAQVLAARRGPGGGPGRLAEETASAQLAASLAALQALAHLDGARRPAAVSATLEVERPDGLISRREWPVHPACGCHWPPR